MEYNFNHSNKTNRAWDYIKKHDISPDDLLECNNCHAVEYREKLKDNGYICLTCNSEGCFHQVFTISYKDFITEKDGK